MSNAGTNSPKKTRGVGRPPKTPGAPMTQAERRRASDQARQVCKVVLSGAVIAALDALRLPGEGRPAAIARLVAERRESG